MHKLSIILLLSILLPANAQNICQPFDFPILLSGNFGELRNNHFHSGIDFKTQGTEGKPVHAVQAGYVSRIGVSPWGYGNVLYLNHPDGTTTVYAHLQRFAPAIARYVKKQQYEQERFRVDFPLSPEQFPVEKGDIIAYSGNTGSSAGPHLHFEVRDTESEDIMDPIPYFADQIFHLSDDQKELADNYAQNLSLFLGDGMFQYTERSDSIPSLGTIRFTDGSTEVVYYNQLDDRYADEPYGTDDIGGYGCGPTSMAIVVSSLTNDTVDPIEMAEWAYQNGYWCSKSGSYHSLIPGAAKAWGLPVEGCTASEPQRIVDALSQGKLVVALMTKGHFTSSGHFIVLRGIQDDKILVADPASYNRSQKAWDLFIILNEASRRAGSGGPFWIIG